MCKLEEYVRSPRMKCHTFKVVEVEIPMHTKSIRTQEA
jgi:hypothetical protein